MLVGDMDDMIQRCVICGRVILNYQNAQFLDCDFKPTGFENGDVYDDNHGTRTKYIEETDDVIDCSRIDETESKF